MRVDRKFSAILVVFSSLFAPDLYFDECVDSHMQGLRRDFGKTGWLPVASLGQAIVAKPDSL